MFDFGSEPRLPPLPRLMGLFPGDVTFNVPFIGTGVWTTQLGQVGGVVRDWEPWMVPSAAFGPQVGGYVKKWKNITYATVRDAGHMVPQYQPAAALVLFTAYLNGQL